MIFLPNDKRTIIQMFLSGASSGDIATQYGVHRATIETVFREAIVQLSEVAVENANKAIQFKAEADRAEMADPRHGESIHEFFKD